MLFLKVKIKLLLAAIPLILCLPQNTIARDLAGCSIKKQKIQTQIRYAKAHHNDYRVAGLERALRRVETNCSDESLRWEREQKIREKQQKVSEREFKLKEAERSGYPKDVSKKLKKLNQAREELSKSQQTLHP